MYTKHRNYVWNITKKLGNLTFSILLLLTISVLSICGTIIEQDQTDDYYMTYYPIETNQIFHIDWRTIIFLKINNLYTSWLFLGLISIFISSLIVCTFSTQLPNLRNARKWRFKNQLRHKKQFKDKHNVTSSTGSSSIYSLNKITYYVFYKKNLTYGRKGLLGRLAPVCVHISIITILVGSCISLFTGISFQEMIPNGEIFHLKNINKYGKYSKIPDIIVGKIEEFRIERYKSQSIKQFYSTVSILDHSSKPVLTRVISVNKPLYYRGVVFYQTDWRVNGLRMRIGNSKKFQISLQHNSNLKMSTANLFYDYNKQIILSLPDTDQHIIYFNGQGNLIQKSNIGETIKIDNIAIQVTDTVSSTGIQAKQDPGIGLIYLSFALLMLSIITSYESYSEIWINSCRDMICLTNKTNRAELLVEEDIVQIIRIIKNQKQPKVLFLK